MRLPALLLLLPLLLPAIGCRQERDIFPGQHSFNIHDGFFEGQAALQMLPASEGFRILLTDKEGKLSDQAIFGYTPYRLDTADVNHDGRTEILVGLLKTTQFDDTLRKRLFILRIDEGQLRPLWLGSKVCQELLDFKTTDGGRVHTFEKTKSGRYAIGHYEWQGFGLALLHYTENEQPYEHVREVFSR